jgi:hypothetical protein
MPPSGGFGASTKAAFEAASVFDFKSGQAGIEQLALRHDDHVVACSDLVATENLSNQSFSPIPRNRASDLFRGRNAQTPNGKRVRQDEQYAERPVNAGAPVVNLLKIGAAANVLIGPQRAIHC